MAFRGWDKDTITLPDGRTVEAITPLIVSASRATDIPAFFAKWFHRRLQEGYLVWTNPFNANQVQHVSFRDTRVIVFWSKNPKPLLPYLPDIDIRGIGYYFQFTLNDYEQEGMEPNVAPLPQRIDTFKRLADLLGPEKVIWRFDPLILANDLTVNGLLDRISTIAAQIAQYTRKLVFSFADIDVYRKVQNNLRREGISYTEFTPEMMDEFAAGLQERNQEWGLELATCAEKIDLERHGIQHNKCVDDELLASLFSQDNALMDFLGYQPDLFSGNAKVPLKDKGQRKECGCIVSKDIGRYDTCHHLCTYCYANASPGVVHSNMKRHDPEAESLLSNTYQPKLRE